MSEVKRSAFDDEVRVILAVFCTAARKDGAENAKRIATAHLVAAAAYLDEMVGPAKTLEMLAATVATISSGQQSKR